MKEAILMEQVEDLFERKARCDIIVMTHALEHTYRPLDVLHGLMGLLKPGGIVLLTVGNPVRIDVLWRGMRKKHYVGKKNVYTWDRPHFVNFLENIAVIQKGKEEQPVQHKQNRPPIRLQHRSKSASAK